MTHIGFALKPIEGGVSVDGPHDLYLDETGNLAMVYGAEAVGQHARQRARTHQGEWFLDTGAGVPWLEQVLGKQADLTLAEALIKAAVLDTDGVESIDGISIRFDRATRGVLIDTLDITTEYEGEQ
jgi:hypothetical protein